MYKIMSKRILKVSKRKPHAFPLYQRRLETGLGKKRKLLEFSLFQFTGLAKSENFRSFRFFLDGHPSFEISGSPRQELFFILCIPLSLLTSHLWYTRKMKKCFSIMASQTSIPASEGADPPSHFSFAFSGSLRHELLLALAK